MSLSRMQSALVELVTHGAGSPGLARIDLDIREQTWLTGVSDHRGLVVTRDVVQSWRWRRVMISAPLTLLMLRRAGVLETLRAAYLDETFAPSAYSLSEGRQFLEFVSGRWCSTMVTGDESGSSDREHLVTFVRLEKAVLAARSSTWTINIRASRPDDALAPGVGGLIRTRCDPRELVRRLLTGEPLPVPGDTAGAFIVAPGIGGGFREASPEEIRALVLVATGCPVAEVAGLWPNDLIDLVTLSRLESIGALVRQPPVSSRRAGSIVLIGSPA